MVVLALTSVWCLSQALAYWQSAASSVEASGPSCPATNACARGRSPASSVTSIGLMANRKAYRAIADALARPELPDANGK